MKSTPPARLSRYEAKRLVARGTNGRPCRLRWLKNGILKVLRIRFASDVLNETAEESVASVRIDGCSEGSVDRRPFGKVVEEVCRRSISRRMKILETGGD